MGGAGPVILVAFAYLAVLIGAVLLGVLVAFGVALAVGVVTGDAVRRQQLRARLAPLTLAGVSSVVLAAAAWKMVVVLEHHTTDVAEVAAGVGALSGPISLAVLGAVGLVAALGWWVIREHAERAERRPSPR